MSSSKNDWRAFLFMMEQFNGADMPLIFIQVSILILTNSKASLVMPIFFSHKKHCCRSQRFPPFLTAGIKFHCFFFQVFGLSSLCQTSFNFRSHSSNCSDTDKDNFSSLAFKTFCVCVCVCNDQSLLVSDILCHPL